MSGKELEAKAPYLHAFMRASAVSRITGTPMLIDAGEAYRHLREPISGIKALNSAQVGDAAFPASAPGRVAGQGRRARYAAARSILQVAGTATELERQLVTNAIAKHVPAEIIEALQAKGVSVTAVRDSIVERLPHLRDRQMADYSTQTGQQTKGIYYHNDPDKLVVVASVPSGHGGAGARRIPGGGDSRSTKDLVLHEIAHAVDFNLHGATETSRLSQGRAFRDAVALDTPNIQSEYVAMGHSEIFAEYMARFMRQPEKVRQECPHLYAYFHTLIHRAPKP